MQSFFCLPDTPHTEIQTRGYASRTFPEPTAAAHRFQTNGLRCKRSDQARIFEL